MNALLDDYKSIDDAGRMDTVTDWASGVTDYDYDFAGRLTTTTLPNGVVQTEPPRV